MNSLVLTDGDDAVRMKNEDISPKTIRSYLIGTLDERTTDAIDELSIADQEFADRVAAEQYDLVDDWVTGRLDPADRAAFGIVLARSPAVAEKVKIAQVMAAAPRVAVVERPSEPGFFAGIFGGFQRPAYALGALALLIGVAITAFLLVRQDKETELSGVSPSPIESPAPTSSVELPDPTASSTLNDIPPQNTPRDNRTKPSPEPPRRANPVFATLILAPPTRGAGGVRSVTLQPAAEFLQLTIQTEAESSGRFLVEVGDPAGRADWRSQTIRGRSGHGRTAVSVRVPAASLKTGLRGVRLLDAAAGSEVLDEHIVRIDRQR